MQRLLRLLPYILRQRRHLVAIFLLTGISAATGALQPWPMKLLVDFALGDAPIPVTLNTVLASIGLGNDSTTLVVVAALASVLLFALNCVIGCTLTLSWTVAGQQIVRDLAMDLFARLQRLSLQYHARSSVGDSLSRLSGDTWCVYSVTDGLLIKPFQQLLTLTVLISVGFALDPILATVTMLVAPFLGWASWFFGSRLKRRARRSREATSRLTSFVHQTLEALPIVQAFATEDRNQDQFQRASREVVTLSQRGSLLGSGYGLVTGLVTTVGTAAVLYIGGVRVMAGAIPLGTLLVFLAYMRRIQQATGGLFKVFATLKTAEASIDRVFEVLDSEDEVRESEKALEAGQPVRGRIQITNVTFGYERGRPVLHEVSLDAAQGETVALVGPTGAGKSTLVSLIPRFCDPWQGQVTLDGVDLRDLKLDSLRRQVSVVLQEPFLLPSSVAANIAYGRPDASREDIVAAAVAAEANSFIERLPQGYDTVLAEYGASLSGGERQRLSIARAILRDAPILILDEPTSALDAKTESQLMIALRRLTERRTTFVIAHRLSTIRHADRIAVLQDGRIVEQGPHVELLDAGGMYHRFYHRQLTIPSKVLV